MTLLLLENAATSLRVVVAVREEERCVEQQVAGERSARSAIEAAMAAGSARIAMQMR